jgi:LPS-assembly lipoprotein
VLSKGNEEEVLRKELYSQAVRSVIDRARAELKKTLP